MQMGALSSRVLLFALGAVTLWLLPRLPWGAVAPFLFVTGLTWSFFQLSRVALASRPAKPENRGLALGTYNAVAGSSTTLAGVSSGALTQHVGYHASYFVAAFRLLGAVLVLSWLPDPASANDSSGDTKSLGSATDTREAQPSPRSECGPLSHSAQKRVASAVRREPVQVTIPNSDGSGRP